MDKAKEDKSKRRKVGTACIYCRRSHMTCDEGRPCKRCIKRDIGHLCHDESTGKTHHHDTLARRHNRASTSSSNAQTPSPSKRLEQDDAVVPGLANTTNNTSSTTVAPSASIFMTPGSSNGGGEMGKMSAPPTLSLNFDASSQNSLNSVNWGNSVLGGAGFLGLGGAGFSGLDGDVAASGDAAGGNEFNILSEFLESLDGSAMPTPGVNASSYPATSTAVNNFENTLSMLSRPQAGAAPLNADGEAVDLVPSGLLPNAQAGAANATPWPPSNPSAGLSAGNSNGTSRRASFNDITLAAGAPSTGQLSSKTEKFFLTAADQKDGTRDERLGRVIQAKYDAGLLRPYNHVNGYARLNKWMEQNASQASRRRILKPLSIFRPAFRAVAQSLTNVDLVYIEEAFERLLLDYDRVFSTQGIPACLWRRTGEIYKGNKEFAELVGVGIEALRDGRCTIYELMQEESAVNYWEKYGAVSFDPGQKAVLTSCVLKTRRKIDNKASATQEKDDDGGFVSCCFSFTIRRDAWSIPCLIVGNFLPL